MDASFSPGDMVLCQPDSGKGCSLCCGLFNIEDISREGCTRFLEGGPRRLVTMTDTPNDDPAVPALVVRDVTSYICPYQGFLRLSKPGCLLHPALLGEDRRDLSLYQKKICGEFLCPAHTILSPLHKRILVNAVDDWYLYSIAIADPESFSWIADMAREMIAGHKRRERLIGVTINKGLSIHSLRLSKTEGPLFCYSMVEYNDRKSGFSLLPENAAYEREDIRKAFQQIIEAS